MDLAGVAIDEQVFDLFATLFFDRTADEAAFAGPDGAHVRLVFPFGKGWITGRRIG